MTIIFDRNSDDKPFEAGVIHVGSDTQSVAIIRVNDEGKVINGGLAGHDSYRRLSNQDLHALFQAFEDAKKKGLTKDSF